jgi:hypothetical protein
MRAGSNFFGSGLEAFSADSQWVAQPNYDEIPAHLSGGNIDHVWITEPILITEDADRRCVVVRGMRNSIAQWTNASAVLFEIVTTADDELIVRPDRLVL